jgi:membrane-associated phospholipid phosphatase
MNNPDRKLTQRGLEAQDLVVGTGALVFAVLSLLWPETGTWRIFGARVAQGYIFAGIYIFMFFLAMVIAPRLDQSKPILAFLRRFYPQACFPPFFMYSIILSGHAMGGRSYDQIFADADAALFGFQPAIEFSRGLSHLSWFNELMFGAYFIYFVILVITPWISHFKGDRKEAERQIYTMMALFLPIGVFYVFFRVQGPKYWFPELHEAWYGSFKGGIFVAFFQKVFSTATLSGAAFPSTHLLLMTMSLRSAYRMDKRLFAFYCVVWVLVSLSTVYIYAHYVVDVVAGAVAALVGAPLVERVKPRIDALCARMRRVETVSAR